VDKVETRVLLAVAAGQPGARVEAAERQDHSAVAVAAVARSLPGVGAQVAVDRVLVVEAVAVARRCFPI